MPDPQNLSSVHMKKVKTSSSQTNLLVDRNLRDKSVKFINAIGVYWQVNCCVKFHVSSTIRIMICGQI